MIPGSANPLLLASAAAAGDYQVSRSLRFNSSDSGFCSRTPAVAGNRRTWTWAGWVKRSGLSPGGYQYIFSTGTGSPWFGLILSSDGTNNRLQVAFTAGISPGTDTNAEFRDVSAWYHIVLAVDTTQATPANRVKIYVNNSETTISTANYPAQNFDTQVNSTVLHTIGRSSQGADSYLNGYLADIHFIDGQALTPAAFTEVSATTGQLIPKAYTGSFGTNGFWLKFSDNSAATATTLGKDYSGNSNNWTPNNLSVTAGAGNDSLVDTPTSYGTPDTGVGGEVRGNYATFNPTESSTSGTKTLTNGNLDVLLADANSARLTIPPIQGSGKYQWEITIGSKTATYYQLGLNLLSMVYATGDLHATFRSDGNLSNTLSGSWSGTGVSYTSGDVITVTYDNATNACAFYKNGVYSATFTVSGTPQASLNFGVFYGGSGNTNYTLNAGQRPFAYPVSGFKALCDTNLTAPVVAKPNTVFDTVLWTGNGSSPRSITGLGFSPDFVWIKERSAGTYFHRLFDANRGTSNSLYLPGTDAENTYNSGYANVTSFNSSGFTLTDLNGGNNSSVAYVAWTWDAGSSTVTNTQGSITSQVRANVSAGFSIVSYTGTGSTGTLGHGLGVKPQLLIVKSRSQARDWLVYHSSYGATQYTTLNGTGAAAATTSAWNNTEPTSTVFTIGNAAEINTNGSTNIAYCFAPVVGYSSMGSYVGNGQTSGVFVYTGFRPRWILIKKSSSTGSWYILDTARDTYNQSGLYLYPDLSSAESDQRSVYPWDILSNGFIPRAASGSVINDNGATYVWMAFAESPFQYARAR